MKKTLLISIVFILLAGGAFFYFIFPGIRPTLMPGGVEISDQGEVLEGGEERGEEEDVDFDLPLSWPDEFRPFVYAGGLGKVRDIIEAENGNVDFYAMARPGGGRRTCLLPRAARYILATTKPDQYIC